MRKTLITILILTMLLAPSLASAQYFNFSNSYVSFWSLFFSFGLKNDTLPSGATYTVKDSRNTSGSNQSVGSQFDGSDKWAAGDFVAGSTYTVTKVTLNLTKNTNPTFNYRVGIYTDSGSTLPSTLVGSMSDWVNAANIVNGDMDFTMNASVTSGTTYWIVVESDRAAFTFQDGFNIQSGFYNCSNGHSATSGNGSSWAGNCVPYDFITYSSP